MTRQAFKLATVDGPGPAGRTAEYVDLARLVDYLMRAVETLAKPAEVAQRGSFLGDTQNPTHYTKVTPSLPLFMFSGGLK